ncbi:MAG: ATP synthase F1 subunit delta [Planctomycetaceae bacterium]|nr:ATP synthase F1 subunit delta [Planctomycetaceae bacterium]
MAEPQTRPTHVLEDPSAKAVARVYAQAYLDAAAGNAADVVEELQSFVTDVLDAQPQFAQLLSSPATGGDQKRQLIDKVVVPHASEFFGNFVKVLAERDRLELLPVIAAICATEHEARSGQKRISVRSASPLSESQLQRIKDRLQAALSIEPLLETSVDEELIGGLVVQVGDTIFDGSLRTRLQNLKLKLRERYLHEIQSGRDRFGHSE